MRVSRNENFGGLVGTQAQLFGAVVEELLVKRLSAYGGCLGTDRR